MRALSMYSPAVSNFTTHIANTYNSGKYDEYEHYLQYKVAQIHAVGARIDIYNYDAGLMFDNEADAIAFILKWS